LGEKIEIEKSLPGGKEWLVNGWQKVNKQRLKEDKKKPIGEGSSQRQVIRGRGTKGALRGARTRGEGGGEANNTLERRKRPGVGFYLSK